MGGLLGGGEGGQGSENLVLGGGKLFNLLLAVN